MKLICFSNNTAGALLCNLLNNNFPNSLPNDYRVPSEQHNRFKVGDTPSVQRTVDIEKWNQKLEINQHSDDWMGTHVHPSAIPNLSVFSDILVVTTTTRTSKLQRWLRYYHGWYISECPNWEESNNMEKIDKIRILASNVFEEFEPYELCRNIEFEDVISGKFVRDNKLNIDYFKQWQQRNPWLYPIDDTSWPVQRFNEAEYELVNKIPYRYI